MAALDTTFVDLRILIKILPRGLRKHLIVHDLGW